MGSIIAPEKILREMAELWVSLGAQPEGEGSTGVLRACSMTLMVTAEETDDAQELGETLAALMPEHPSRVIVIRLRASSERALAARGFAQCWMPFGQRRQICCEQIEITASDASLPDVPAVVLPLAVPDLPVILWCRSPRLFRLPAFPQLAGTAQKLVLDSGAFGEPRAVLRELAAAVRSGQRLGDLSWTRLTRWRELISQIFENRLYLARLPQLYQVRLGFAGEAAPVSAWYMAAWLLDGLRSAGGSAQFSFEPVAGETPGALRRVELTSRNNQDLQVSIALVEGQAAEIRVDTLVHRSVFPRPSDYLLMREELSVPGRDPVFEKTLSEAARLALSS